MRPSSPTSAQLQQRVPNSPANSAEFLARKVSESFDGVVSAEPTNAKTLRLEVRPDSLGVWDWWLDRFHVPVGTATYRGSCATAKGSFGRVTVLLTGLGVGELVAAEFRNNGGAS